MPASIESQHYVEQEIINPMRQRWAQPKTGDAQDISVLINDYVDDLHQYSRPVLQAAFVRVRQSHELSTWPRSASFVKACREIESRETAGAQHASGSKYPWEIKHELARKLQREYLNEKLRSPLMLEAMQNGWAWKLMHYVADAAWHQAQHIAECRNVGFNHNTLGDAPQKPQSGKIEISIPVEMLQQWRGEV